MVYTLASEGLPCYDFAGGPCRYMVYTWPLKGLSCYGPEANGRIFVLWRLMGSVLLVGSRRLGLLQVIKEASIVEAVQPCNGP